MRKGSAVTTCTGFLEIVRRLPLDVPVRVMATGTGRGEGRCIVGSHSREWR